MFMAEISEPSSHSSSMGGGGGKFLQRGPEALKKKEKETLFFKSAFLPLTPPTPRSLGWFKLPRASVGAGKPSTDHLLGLLGEGVRCGGVAVGVVFLVLPGSPDVRRAART